MDIILLNFYEILNSDDYSLFYYYTIRIAKVEIYTNSIIFNKYLTNKNIIQIFHDNSPIKSKPTYHF